LAAGDFEQAHSLVHNLKGLAGNLAATDLQAATVEIEKLVKGNQAKSSTAGQLNRKFTELEKAINQALKAVQTLGSSTEEIACEISEGMIAEVPAELIKGACNRIKEAVDTGDVMGVKSIAEELKAKSDAITPISDKFIQLAEDFDFDGILKFAGEVSR
jgi:HPt (histidine-containing phosphotransfer) domain-containing protein